MIVPAERIYERATLDENGCWIWQGSRHKLGYGSIGKHRLAHRVAYESFVGPIPKGLELDHLCRNPSCVNPAHLEPVTHRENILRGNTFLARQVARTHCPQGHAYDAANTYVSKAGERHCRACHRDRMRASRRHDEHSFGL